MYRRRRDGYLCSPITKIVHRNDVPPAGFVEVREERPEDGAPDVTNMEAFGNVRRRIFDDHLLACTRVVVPVRGNSTRGTREIVYLTQDSRDEVRGIEGKM